MTTTVTREPASNSDCDVNKQKAGSSTLTPRGEIVFILALFYGSIACAACNSLQAPFFPRIAEQKGASPGVYGFIFGIREVTILFISPFFGKLVASISCNVLMQFGLAVAGISVIAFGLTVFLPSGFIFILACFIFRIINGIGISANFTACYSAMAQQFPTKTAFVFGILEVAFALGSILGPTFGGILYQVKGYSFPFLVLGSILFSASFINRLCSPKIDTPEARQPVALRTFLADFDTIVDLLGIIVGFTDLGLLNVLLEPHLRSFNLTPFYLGLFFICEGSAYAISSPIIGWIVDHGVPPKVVNLFCCFISLVGGLFIGPLPIMTMEPQVWMIIPSLVFLGIGEAGLTLCGFMSIKKETITRRGFLENIETYGLITSTFLSCTSAGFAIGPSIGGLMMEATGTRGTTSLIVGLNIFMIILLTFNLIRRSRQKSCK